MRMLRIAVLVAFGAPVLLDAQSALSPGELRNKTMTPREEETLVLALEADQCARLELETRIALSVTLRRPDGTTSLLTHIAGEESAPAPFTIVAAQSGRHSLELRLNPIDTGGSYTLRFVELRRATARGRQEAEGEAQLREGLRLFWVGARESGSPPESADHYKMAVEQLKKAAEIFTALDNQPMLAKSIDRTALAYNRLGDTRL